MPTRLGTRCPSLGKRLLEKLAQTVLPRPELRSGRMSGISRIPMNDEIEQYKANVKSSGFLPEMETVGFSAGGDGDGRGGAR